MKTAVIVTLREAAAASRIYIGIHPTGEREIFRCASIPSAELVDGLYVAAVGPFLTRAGAEFMRDHGQNNPHCVSVGDAERFGGSSER